MFPSHEFDNPVPTQRNPQTWHNGQWYFSVIDIVSVLTEQPDFKKSQSYWTTLKSRLKKEGNESVTNCDKLKMQSAVRKKLL